MTDLNVKFVGEPSDDDQTSSEITAPSGGGVVMSKSVTTQPRKHRGSLESQQSRSSSHQRYRSPPPSLPEDELEDDDEDDDTAADADSSSGADGLDAGRDQNDDEDDFEDDANTYNDEWNDDYDTRSIEYSLHMNQSDELSRYLSMKIDINHYRSNVLTFWKSNTDELPCLSQIARQIHSIPATSAGIERQFTIAGFTLISRRTCLDPEQVDNMIYIRSVAKLDSQI